MANRLPMAFSATVSQKDIARVTKRLDKMQGAELAKRTQKAILGGASIMVTPIRSQAPVRTGRLQRSVGARTLRKKSGEIAAAYAGPRIYYGQWVQKGTSRGMPANPFVEKAQAMNEGDVHNFIDEQIRRLE